MRPNYSALQAASGYSIGSNGLGACGNGNVDMRKLRKRMHAFERKHGLPATGKFHADRKFGTIKKICAGHVPKEGAAAFLRDPNNAKVIREYEKQFGPITFKP